MEKPKTMNSKNDYGDCKGKVAGNKNEEGIAIENEVLNLKREEVQTSAYPNLASVTRSDGQDLMA